MSERIRVLLVEDDQDLCETIKTYLSLVGFSVTAVNCGADYYKALAADTFNAAIIDINLPDQSGLVLAEYTRKNTQLAIIILTAGDTLKMRIESYQKGSDLFLAKPVDCQELEAAIKSLVSRKISASHHSSGTDIEHDVWSLDRHSRQLFSPDGKAISLTGKEYHFLDLLAVTPGVAIKREYLLDQLYSCNDDSTNHSLETLVSRVRNKITRLSGLSSPILCVYGVGYSFSTPFSLH